MQQDSANHFRNIGVGLAIGGGTGIALFAATGNAAFIGVGAAIGIPIAIAMYESDRELTREARRLLLAMLGLGIVVLVAITATFLLMR